jgi:hypothetical protein
VNHPEPRTGMLRMHNRNAVNRNKFAERNLIKFSAIRGVCRRLVYENSSVIWSGVRCILSPMPGFNLCSLRNVCETCLRGQEK